MSLGVIEMICIWDCTLEKSAFSLKDPIFLIESLIGRKIKNRTDVVESLCDSCSEELFCEVCGVRLNEEEISDSIEFIGGDRYFCEYHLSQKLDW